MTYVTLTYPTIRSSFQLVVARGESFPRFIFHGFAMPSAAEKTFFHLTYWYLLPRMVPWNMLYSFPPVGEAKAPLPEL